MIKLQHFQNLYEEVKNKCGYGSYGNIMTEPQTNRIMAIISTTTKNG